MVNSLPTPVASQSNLFVLALGLLVGFVIAFVLLLSQLPTDDSQFEHADSQVDGAGISDIDFDYYLVLQEQQAARKSERQIVISEPPVVFIDSPSEVLPQSNETASSPKADRLQSAGNDSSAQSASQTPVDQPLALREIPASRSGQDSYYVEAGNYRDSEQALQAQGVLRSLGLEAFIVVRQDNSGSFGHRVRVGPFFEQSRLDATRERLRASGIKPRLIRVKG